MRTRSHALFGIAVLFATCLIAQPVSAFCGFFVGSTDKLYNDATQVVLMRAGTDTVLSMRPDYSGPVDDFAMVVPVPQVLQKEDVLTLTARPFETIDTLSAPRLVEYHEQDPCAHRHLRQDYGRKMSKSSRKKAGMGKGAMKMAPPPKVRVKAQFTRAEYEIVILDADESSALETWLNEHGYKQPPGAAKALAPYIQEGFYFFAAKVDAKKVTFEPGGKAVLSPLQFRYASDKFQLPIRLGLLNAKGKQDLMIFVLAEQRYEAANRKNIFIPTNISVSAERKKDFAEWYDKLFERQTSKREATVVTEYVWPTAIKCDPCPPGTTMLGAQNIAELGGELLKSKINPQNLVLTRMHTRYGAEGGTSDIVFQKAKPVVGGREIRTKGKLEQGATSAPQNAFQGRYAIRYKWRGKLTCDDPRRGIWTHQVAGLPPGLGRPIRRRPNKRPAPMTLE